MQPPTMRSVCTGYGGMEMAIEQVFGARLVDWSDISIGSIAVMSTHRPGLPNLGDVKSIDWSSLEPTDIFAAGYPCQPFSEAGLRLGVNDPRHLWPWLLVGIRVVRPRVIILENVAAHLRRGFDVVLADLAQLGYDVTWSIVRASDIGAPHERRRLFIIATDAARELLDWSWYPRTRGRSESSDRRDITSVAQGDGRFQGWAESARQFGRSHVADSCGIPSPERWGKWSNAVARWESIRGVAAPDAAVPNPRAKVGRSLNPVFVEWMMGLPPGWVTAIPGLSRNAMLELLGNGIVPQQAEHAIRGLWERQIYARANRGAT